MSGKVVSLGVVGIQNLAMANQSVSTQVERLIRAADGANMVKQARILRKRIAKLDKLVSSITEDE